MTDEQTLDLLKSKDPARYKAISIASLGFFKDEKLVTGYTKDGKHVLGFVDQMADYIKELSNSLKDGKPQLKYHLTEEALNIDTLSATLVKDIKDGDSEDEMITTRLKSLVLRTLDALKESTSKYTEKHEELLIEQCLGYYDQLMILKNISALADETK